MKSQNIFRKKCVYMRQEGYEKLSERYGKKVVDYYIDLLIEFRELDPEKFSKIRLHAQVIRHWIQKEQDVDNFLCSEEGKKETFESFAKKIIPQSFFTGNKIILNEDNVTIVYRNYKNKIKYTDFHFFLKCSILLKKLKIKFSSIIYD